MCARRSEIQPVTFPYFQKQRSVKIIIMENKSHVISYQLVFLRLLLTSKILNKGFLWVKLKHLGRSHWLTFMEYLCHRWPRIYSNCRGYIRVLFSSIKTSTNTTYHICFICTLPLQSTWYHSKVFVGALCCSVFVFFCVVCL